MRKEILDFIEKRKRVPLIAYLPALYPDTEGFMQTIRLLAGQGLKFIEIGLPTATPFLDGEIIKNALLSLERRRIGISEFNCRSGSIIRDSGLNGVSMLYEHTLKQYGMDRFISDCRHCGTGALLVPDISAENREIIFNKASEAGIETVNFIRADQGDEEIKEIINLTSGFLYLQSSGGPTGGQFAAGRDFRVKLEKVKRLAEAVNIPVGVGFGINSPSDADEAEKAGADAVIVGTSFLKAVIGGDKAVLHYLDGFRKFLEVA